MRTYEWLAAWVVCQLAVGAILGATLLAIASSLGAVGYVLFRYFGTKLMAQIKVD